MAQRSSAISGCGRVDTHHHFLPSSVPEMQTEMEEGGPIPIGAFPKNPQDHLDFMDKHGIQTAVLSASIEARFAELSPAELLDLCERTWKAHQDYVKVNALRFGSFAMLPFPYADEALKFIEGSTKGDIVPDGFTVATSLGALDKIHATVFVHPTDNAVPPNLNIPTFVLEFTFNTARCLLGMILAGVLTRYPNIRFIFSHNGGVYPYIVHRAIPIESLIKANNNNRSSRDLLRTSNIFFDTALSYKSQFSVVQDLGLPVEHVLFGSDHPYTTAVNNESLLLGFDSPALSGVLSDDDCNVKISRENALNLFPRLKKLYREEFPEHYAGL